MSDAKRRQQRGSTLMISLVMLAVLSLLAVAAINISTGSLRAVTNMQSRNETMDVAQRRIEQLVSANLAAGDSPEAIRNGVLASVGNTVIAVDGKNYTVSVPAAPCIRQFYTILNEELDAAAPTHDAACLTANADRADRYIYCLSDEAKCRNDAGGGGGASYCSTAVWEINARVQQGWFGAASDIVQGVRIRMWTDLVGDPSLRCPA